MVVYNYFIKLLVKDKEIKSYFTNFVVLKIAMKKIDRETVQKILDTAEIVDVVSDFVHLKRRGAGYIGLCPFHNERTPSFSVSKSKGICKCFSCGKGGSPVNFLMELEQMSYYDALRYLAKKYHIEIKEHEMTDKELQNKLNELKSELFFLRFKNATNQLTNPMVLVETRRDIARIKTVIRQRELAAPKANAND